VSDPPKNRPLRIVLWTAYGVATIFFCACLYLGVYRGARERQGRAPQLSPLASVDAEARRQCTRDLGALYRELNERLEATLLSRPARRSSAEWEQWSPSWRSRLLAAGARCRLQEGDAPGTLELRRAFRELSEVHRHYTTLAVQYAKEIGPSTDELHQSMQRLGGAGDTR
jgi:hypothetical protein